MESPSLTSGIFCRQRAAYVLKRNLYPYTRYVPRRTDQIAVVRQKIGSFDFNGSNFSRIDTLVSLPCRQGRSRCRQGNDCFLVDRLYLIQRDCRKNPGSKNVQKNLPQQAKKQPKYSQNVVRNTKNQTLFSVSLPLFKNNYWKVTYSTVSTVCAVQAIPSFLFLPHLEQTLSHSWFCAWIPIVFRRLSIRGITLENHDNH